VKIMAILKTLLEEDILTKQERTVLRSIYRAQALNEGIIALARLADTMATSSEETYAAISASKQIVDYLKVRCQRILTDIKVPNAPSSVKDPA
jgi:hypothetical protein